VAAARNVVVVWVLRTPWQSLSYTTVQPLQCKCLCGLIDEVCGVQLPLSAC
jgi:hypothetical protein